MAEQNSEKSGRLSGLLGALKDAVWEDDGKGKTAPKVAPAAAVAASGPSASGVAPAASVSIIDANSPMVKDMMGIVMGKTTAYTTLVEAITPLEQFLPDEQARYKAAFSIVGKTRTIDQIVQAIEMQHIPALEAEVQKFTAQAQNKETNEISARKRKIESLQANIKSANEEADRIRKQTEARLAELETSVAQSGEKIAQMVQEINQEQAQIAKINEQFNAAVAVVKTILTDARSKVLRYLAA